MQYAVHLPNFGPYGEARTLANLARDAEEAGWDGFFIWDHIVPRDIWAKPMVDPWVALTAIAMHTSRIVFGPQVTPLPRRRPWKVARETASLDRLSDGRLILGVGSGTGRACEWANFGEATEAKQRGAMLDEALAIIDGLWQGEMFDFQGAYYHVEPTQFVPSPIQSPRIPIWTAGYWPSKVPFRRAACWDGVFPLFDKTDQEPLPAFKNMLAFLRENRGDNTAPFDVVYSGRTTPGNAESLATVVAVAEAGATWWFEPIAPHHFGGQLIGDWPLEAMNERIHQGPPRI